MLYFESENELTFYNLEACPSQYSWINTTSGKEKSAFWFYDQMHIHAQL